MQVKCFFNNMKLPLGGTPLVPDPLSGHMNTTAAAAASSADNKRKIQMTQSASANQSTILNHPHHHQSGTSNINSNSSTSAAHSIASSISTNAAAAVATHSTLNHNNSVTATTSSIMSTVSATASDSNAAVGSSSTNNSSSQEQFSVKARQEVYVMQRVSELQRDGLWTERRLPKVQEPQRPKAHWDYLLEEMVWLAADFAQERKWKKAAAKKCARMVQKHFQDKAQAAQKAEKAQELQLKRIANFLSKEVKIFWSNVEKLVEYKQHTKLEEKRKKALDQHLSFIVDQTEKFSAQLAEGMNKTTTDAAGTSAVPSLNSSRRSSPKPSGGGSAGTSAAVSDDEFSPGNASSDDDEETIAKAEAEATADVTAEVAALQKESEMELDDFLSELPKDYLQNRDKIILDEKQRQSDDDDEQAAAATSDEEFRANELSDGTDEEDTIAEQEQNENKVDHKMEIDDLNVSINYEFFLLVCLKFCLFFFWKIGGK